MEKPKEQFASLPGPNAKWNSRKLAVAVLALLLVALNRAMGLDMSLPEIVSLAGVAASYLLGQSYVDGRWGDSAVLDLGESLSPCACTGKGTSGLVSGYVGSTLRPWPDERADAAAGSEELPFAQGGVVSSPVFREQARRVGKSKAAPPPPRVTANPPSGFVLRPVLAILAALALAATLCACAPSGSGTAYTSADAKLQAEQVQYGIQYLRGSLAATIEAAEAAKAKDPANAANAAYVDQQFRPVIDELSAAVDAYDAAYAAEREDRWRFARALISTAAMTAIRVGVPMAIEAAAHR